MRLRLKLRFRDPGVQTKNQSNRSQEIQYMMPADFINTRDTYIAQLERITTDENNRQIANYKLAYQNWLSNVAQKPIGSELPPTPTPALKVGLAFDNQNTPVITLGPDMVCDKLGLPPSQNPNTELIVNVGLLQDAELGVYGVGAGDNAPAGFEVELEDGTLVRKTVKKGPFGSWKWYQRV